MGTLGTMGTVGTVGTVGIVHIGYICMLMRKQDWSFGSSGDPQKLLQVNV